MVVIEVFEGYQQFAYVGSAKKCFKYLNSQKRRGKDFVKFIVKKL